MKKIDLSGLQTDMKKRFDFLCEFMLFTDEDWKSIKESVEVLGPKLPGLLDAIYDHLLSFDDTRRLFIGARGEVDPAYIAVRKEHLTDWVLRIVGAEDRGAFAAYLASVGRKHTGVEGEPHRSVPPRYMVGLSSFVQTALTATLLDGLSDDLPRARRMILAWNKMMMIQLEIFLKVIAPHWPAWDEA